jgi:hypothetical protein
MESLEVLKYKNEHGLFDQWTYRGKTLLKVEFAYPKAGNNSKIKIRKMELSKKEELFEQINDLYTSFVDAHNGKTKSSQSKARKHIGEIKKLVTDYRKASVDESKK